MWFRKLIGITMFFSSWYLRNKYSWIGNLIYPISFYVMLSLVGGATLSNQALIGALIATIWMSGVGYFPQFLFVFKFAKLREMFVAAPIHPLTYMLGAALSVLISSIPSLGILFLLLAFTTQVTILGIVSLVLILLVTWLMSSCLGFVVAGYVTDPNRIGTISPFLGALLTTLPPIYYPLESIAPQYRWLVLLIPTVQLSQLGKVLTGVSSLNVPPALLLFVLPCYLILFVSLASYKSHWREK